MCMVILGLSSGGVVEKYLDCGYPMCGLARIRCPGRWGREAPVDFRRHIHVRSQGDNS